MHNVLLAIVLVISFCSAALADEKLPTTNSAVDVFTGELWQNTSPEEKQAFLYGIDTAVNVEVYVNDMIRENAKKTGKTVVSNLSPFEKGWMKAFKKMSRKEIILSVDNWYATHTDQLAVPVMKVIWDTLIEPKLEGHEK